MKRSNELNTTPRTVEELFGADYNGEIKKYFKEKELPNDTYKSMLYKTDPEWNAVCSANVYGHIRLCGRKAQKAAEDRSFLLDDLFRIYGFGTSGTTKYEYNREAHLWVFYIGMDIPGERAKSIWIQTPNSIRARHFEYKGLSLSGGLKVGANPRDKSAYKHYIEPYEKELEELTSKYYKEFKSAFSKVQQNFNDIAGRTEDLPANSFAEWPNGLLYA